MITKRFKRILSIFSISIDNELELSAVEYLMMKDRDALVGREVENYDNPKMLLKRDYFIVYRRGPPILFNV